MEDSDFYTEIKKYDEEVDKAYNSINTLNSIVTSNILYDSINNSRVKKQI